MSDTATPETAPARRRAVPKRTADAPSISELCSREAYQAGNAHLFPSLPSLKWFIRQQRAELLEAGALLELAGRHVIDVSKFSDVVRAVGQRAAAARARAR